MKIGDGDNMSDLGYLATAFIIMIGLIAAWSWSFYNRLKSIDERIRAIADSSPNSIENSEE